jgi:DNA-binding PadR family transcriptional regulator
MSNRKVTVEGHIKKLNPTAATLLGFLHRGPMTGWDLAQMAEMVIGDFWNVSRSQVYRELRTLEGLQFVTASAAGSRERKPYTITDDGRTAFATFIQREPGPDLHRSPLLLMVFFGSHLDPTRRDRFLSIQQLRHEQALDEYLRIQASLDPDEIDLANVLQYAIFHEEAVLRWFEWMERASREPVSRPAWPERGDQSARGAS